MANTSAIFKGAYTKLLTKSGLLLEAGQKIKVTDGAALYSIPVSDASGELTVQALPAAAVPSLDASKITTGTFDIARIPNAAMERLVYVADQTARYALTTATVQNGDSVYQNDTLTMYIVIDDTQLNGAGGYQVYMTNVQWSNVLSKPAYATQAATALLDGYLTSTDWSTFNGKEAGGAVSAHAGLSTTHGVSGSIVGTSDTQTLSNKTIDNGILINHEASVTTPAAGKVAFFAKSDDYLYVTNSAGTTALVGQEVKAINSDVTLTKNCVHLVDTSAGRTLTLPTPALNMWITVKDKTGSAQTNNITISRAGSEKIETVAASYTISTDLQSLTFVSDGTDWFIV